MSEEKKQSSYRKRSFGTFISNWIGLGITGLVCGIAGTIFGASRMTGMDSLAGGFMGLVLGYVIGVMLGIVWLNKVRRYYGSLSFGLLGSFIGLLAAIVLEEPLNLNLDPIILFGTFFIIVPLLGMIGFYSRKQAGGAA